MATQDLYLRSCWMNAAGMLGFSLPRGIHRPVEMGAFVTNPASLAPRSPAVNRCTLRFPGGMLLHTGHPNPGLKAVLQRQVERWRRSDLPVWVHLLSDDPAEMAQMVRMLEDCSDVVMAVEIGIHPGAKAEEALAVLQAACGELPVIAAIPLTAAGQGWLNELDRMGVSAISLTAPRGVLPGRDGKLTGGRLYGPALFPLAVNALQLARRAGLPVIAGCGVYSVDDGEALLQAGALAVQFDTVLWNVHGPISPGVDG